MQEGGPEKPLHYMSACVRETVWLSVSLSPPVSVQKHSHPKIGNKFAKIQKKKTFNRNG